VSREGVVLLVFSCRRLPTCGLVVQVQCKSSCARPVCCTLVPFPPFPFTTHVLAAQRHLVQDYTGM
jgi:hypothetical protein